MSLPTLDTMEPQSLLLLDSSSGPAKDIRRNLLLTQKKRPLLSKQSSDSCTSTEDETSIGSSSDDELEIHLITRPTTRTRQCFSPPQAFARQLQEASLNPSQTSLHLTNFIERSTRHDVYALRDLLLQDDRQWTSVRLEDTCPADNFRRWAYKKENVNHHIQKLCLNRKIPLEYHARIQLGVDTKNIDKTIAMVAETKKHPEVRRLDLVGRLDRPAEEALLKAVTALIRLQDRDWDAVNVHTGFDGDDDYEAWRELMVHYMGIFSGLYTRYNIPIDVRPCAD